MKMHLFTTPVQKDYALLDSGDGLKLERYSDVTVVRPDPQALWKTKLPESEWEKADARFNKTTGKIQKDTDDNGGSGAATENGKWALAKPGLAEQWPIQFGDLTLQIELTPFKHTGLFPEQLNNWLWFREIIETAAQKTGGSAAAAKPKVLNLFGYTGGASLSAALAGAEVTHVDASRSAINWANKNAKLSGLSEKPIRWILEDAVSFVKRELRRGSKYDAIIMDPPSFGRGTKGEVWKIEEHFMPLFEDCLELLSDKPLFFVLNGYAAGYSPIAYENNLARLVEKYGGEVESGELAIEESANETAATSAAKPTRLLPCGIVSRWKAAL